MLLKIPNEVWAQILDMVVGADVCSKWLTYGCGWLFRPPCPDLSIFNRFGLYWVSQHIFYKRNPNRIRMCGERLDDEEGDVVHIEYDTDDSEDYDMHTEDDADAALARGMDPNRIPTRGEWWS